MPLKELVEGRTTVSTFVDDIARVRGLGEYWFGIRRKVDNLVYINVGTGCVL